MSKCEMFDSYKKQEWLDEIVDVDDGGNVLYERDEDGNVVHLTDHFGRLLHNPFTGEPTPKVKLLQEGTRVTARRMNHIEKHICSLYGWKNIHGDALKYVMIVLELEGMVEGGQGTFFDSMDNLTPKGIVLDDYLAELSRGVAKGAAQIEVDDVGSLKIGDELNIYDERKFETVTIKSIDGRTITVTELKNNYEEGSYVARSTVTVDRENREYRSQAYTVYNVSSKVI